MKTQSVLMIFVSVILVFVVGIFAVNFVGKIVANVAQTLEQTTQK
jgi:hypothetical protein